MTITFRAGSTPSVSTLTPSPSYPAGVTATDINILTVHAKPNSGVQPANVTCTAPAGWTLLFAGTSGSSPPPTPEASGGSINIWIFTRTGGAFTGSVPVTLTNHSTAGAYIDTYAGTLGGWNTSTTYGYDNDSSGNPYNSNATVASVNLSITTNDWLLVRTSLSNLSGVSSPVITATGATLSGSTLRHTGDTSMTTPDNSFLWYDARDVTVTSGTSTAGPKLALSNVQDGISVFILLREGIRAVSGSETVTTLDRSSLGARDDLPVTRVWANGDDLSAELMNTHFSNVQNWFLKDAPGIQLECTTTPNLTTSTHTVTWDKIVTRRGGLVFTGTKISVPTNGYYVGQVTAGFEDIGVMNVNWVFTYELLVYPAAGGAAYTAWKWDSTDMNGTEVSFTAGSVPFGLYLNRDDAVEFKISGAWGTAGTRLWANGAVGNRVLIDLHWDRYWAGGTF